MQDYSKIGKGGIVLVFKLLLSAIVVSKLGSNKLFKRLSLGATFKKNTFQSSGPVNKVCAKFLKSLLLPSLFR